MVIIFLILGVLIVIAGLRLYEHDWELTGAITLLLGFSTAVIALISSAFLISDCVESRYIDDKIAMYQEENKSIEKDVSAIVEQYQEHETEVFDMSEVESPATLIQMYPELKSDDLVMQQIKIFSSNNKKIKELKLKKINYEKAKFLLYFGGK